MADDVLYSSVKHLTLPELRDLLGRIFEEEPTELKIPDGDIFLEGVYKRLAPLPPGTKLGRVRVAGRMKLIEPLLAEFRRLSTELLDCLKWGRSLRVDIAFELVGFRQNPGSAATLGLSLTEGGQLNLAFEVGRLGSGKEHRVAKRELMNRLAEWGRFPVRIELDSDFFRLSSSEDVSFRVRQAGPGDKNPGGFDFRADELGVDGSLELLRATIEEWGSGRIHRAEWVASTAVSQGDREAGDFYRRVLRGEFRAERYELWAALRATTLEELEGARCFCAGSMTTKCEIGSIPLEDDNYGTIWVVAGEAGYQIEISCPYPMDLESVEERVGLKLLESGLA